ncbi:MAG TPA: CheR family methyltransferase [Chloroflexota bacterium]|nr:CheR family methyltransferase [Chloroflexota bacterium]
MQTETPPVRQLVVVGASAGGVEALSTLVSTLPTDFPAPVVIAQHLDRNRVSHLEEILSRRSTLPVRTVLDVQPLRAGIVYVVPADHDVEISDHHVGIRTGAAGGPKPSVDLLLGTAAQVFGEELYAVILTGTGSDGANGARLVKEAGGTVVIQNPETASFPGMPLSLAPTTVDIVADLDAIGPLLHDLLVGSYAPPSPEADRRMRALLEQLRKESGIDFSRYRQPTIQRRLRRRMADTGRETLDEYLRFLQRHPEEYQRLADSFLIKVTDFFRDPELFAVLRERILPELIAEARGRGNELRLWSAGAATGEEAYSLAILLADLLGDELEDFSVRVFATDVNSAAIDFARRGVYPPGALHNVAPELLHRYFIPVDGSYEIKKLVRRFVVFGQHDLAQRSPFPRIDLLLCRNVLIYFTPELQRRVLQLFAFALRTGGRLVLGKSEATSGLAEYFVLEEPRLKIYRRQGERMLIAPTPIRDRAPLPPPLPPARSEHGSGVRLPPPVVPLRPPAESGGERLLQDLPVGVVVVDRHYDVQAINSVARRLLAIHTPAIGEDLVHLARRMDSERLRTVIDQALQGVQAVERIAVKSLDAAPDGIRHLEVTCFPQQTTSPADSVDRVVIIVSELAAPAEPPPTRPTAEPQAELERLVRSLEALETGAAEPATRAAALAETRAAVAGIRQELERLTGLVTDLSASRQELLAANQELTTANAELRTHNEELLVGNEEAQAALEEIETLNEEQQATNEELETLNEELQATIEELNTANDDLEARGVQLQETAAAFEAERSRLAAVLSGMSDAVLVVDREGQTILANAAYERLLTEDGAELPPLDEHGQPLPAEATPRQRAARGETFETPFTVVAAGGAHRWFEARGQPIQSAGQEGGILVIRDISERSFLRQQTESLALVSHELRTPLTAIVGNLQLLLRQPASEAEPARLRQYAATSLQQARLLARLIDDLADFVRLQEDRFRLELAPVDLGPLVAELVEIARLQTTGQTIRYEPPAEPLVVEGDARRLQQVGLNLLTNAIKYAAGTEFIDVGLRRINGHAELTVQDYGPGIPAADQPNVFSRFYQAAGADSRARGGLGLGLYICRAIVEAHGGTIDLRSREGEGATFTVRLPLRPASEA